MIEINSLKLSAAIIIFAVALAGGAIPLLSRNFKIIRILLQHSNAFARGIFLGAGLIHLLPDAESNLSHVLKQQSFPYVLILCAFTLFILQLIDRGSSKIFNKNDEFISALPCN